ncbi:EcsC family protein [Bacillus sp. FJAT-47783]|uniref:EcsC family protein n=1 Tax=Bacillus sp. FJAT-47783 TaxID=2922712 RepID=UPI001FAC88EA|nr:EcsC family protein [Bacillus sp. FJAT-47783]
MIQKWEKDQKGFWFWEKIGRIPFKLLDRLTPQVIHQKVGQMLDEVGSYIQTGGKYLINKNEIVKRFIKVTGENDLDFSRISQLSISTMDEVSEGIIQSRKRIAMTQGATTGIGGIFTLTIDIPLILGISIKTLQEIAISYGYDPNEKQERIFIVKCLQFASSDIVGKQAILDELSSFASSNENFKKQTISQMQGWKEVMMNYRDNFGWKKLFQMIPIAGIIFGSFVNKSMVEDIGEAGKMLYKKRRILEKLEQYD